MVLILALLTFASSISHAAAPAVCSDLHALTCSNKERKDPTGAAVTVFPDDLLKRELIRLRSKVTDQFRQTFNANENQELKQAIIEALPVNDRGGCTTTLNSSECNYIASHALGDLYFITEEDPARAAEQRLFDARLSLAILKRDDYKSVAAKVTADNTPLIKPELVNKIERDLFPNVKALLLKRIRSLQIDNATKQLLVAKINRTKFAGINCDSKRDVSTGLVRSLVANANYNNATGEIRLCPSQLRFSSSEFELVSVLAHEMSHSIDPCFLHEDKGPFATQASRLSDDQVADQYLAKGFITCLRSEKSIHARKVPLNLGEEYDFAMSNTLTRFCEKDQIVESTADWFAAEVVAQYAETRGMQADPKFTQAQYVAGFSNIYRQSCQKHQQLLDHPLTRDRINSILLVQPKVRAMMGCPADAPDKQYCDLNNPKSLQPVSKSKAAVQMLRKVLAPAKSKQ